MSEKQYIKKIKKGFSLVELMVVIAIIAILAAVAIPMYGNYSIRAKLGSEIEKLGSAKAAASDYMSNNANKIDYTVADLGTLPSGASVGDNGVLLLDTSNIVADSSISLTPTIGSGAIIWGCSGTGLTSSQLPSECQEASSEAGNNSGDSGAFDPSQFKVSDSFGGYPCGDGNTCYGYGSDISVLDGPDAFFYATYPGAGDGGKYEDVGLELEDVPSVGIHPDMIITSGKNDEGNEVYYEFTSKADYDARKSELSEAQQQVVSNAIDAAKSVSGGKFCEANSTNWVCQ